MHRYASKPSKLSGVILTDSPSLPKRSALRWIADHTLDLITATLIVWCIFLLIATLEN